MEDKSMDQEGFLNNFLSKEEISQIPQGIREKLENYIRTIIEEKNNLDEILDKCCRLSLRLSSQLDNLDNQFFELISHIEQQQNLQNEVKDKLNRK